MTRAYLAFTAKGLALAQKLAAAYPGSVARCGHEAGQVHLADWTARQFPGSDALVFVGAVGLAVRAIAEAEQITVSNAEVDAEYARLAKLHDTPEPEIRKVLNRDAVASAVTTQKVQRFLIEHANSTSVVEGE